jgi:hypothetical protein
MAFGNLPTYYGTWHWKGGRWVLVDHVGPAKMEFAPRTDLKMRGHDVPMAPGTYFWTGVWTKPLGATRWILDFKHTNI